MFIEYRKIAVGLLIVGISLLSVLCTTTGTTFAESGSVPVYLNQEPTVEETPDSNSPDSLPKTFDEGIMQFVLLLAICATGLLCSLIVINNKRKGSNENKK